MEAVLAAGGSALAPRLGGVTGGRLEQAPSRERTFDEQAAVARARGGDEQAFAELVARYGPPILSLCFASTFDAGEAEDAAQEIFLAAWKGLRRFRGEAAFSTWLFALARNRCVDRARRAAARPKMTMLNSASEPTIGAVDEASRRTAAAIMAAASELSLPLCQALLLRDVQGLSYDEIAQLQNVPIGTVRSRIAGARSTVAARVTE